MQRTLLLLALSAVSGAASAELYFDVYGGATRTENINYSGDKATEQSDTITSLTGLVGYKFKPGPRSFMDARLKYTRNTHSDFTELDSEQIELDTSLRHFLTKATWLRFGLEGGVADYEDDNRDSSLFGSSLSVGTHLNKELSVEGGYRFRHRDADEAVYTTDHHALFGDAVYTLSDELYTYAKLELGTGEITSVAASGSISDFEEELADDAAFGVGSSAYLLEADSLRTEVGAHVSLGGNLGVNLGYAYSRYDVDALDEAVVDGVWKFSFEIRK